MKRNLSIVIGISIILILGTFGLSVYKHTRPFTFSPDIQAKLVFTNTGWYAFYVKDHTLYFAKAADQTHWGIPVKISGANNPLTPSAIWKDSKIYISWLSKTNQGLNLTSLDLKKENIQSPICTTAHIGTFTETDMTNLPSVAATKDHTVYIAVGGKQLATVRMINPDTCVSSNITIGSGLAVNPQTNTAPIPYTYTTDNSLHLVYGEKEHAQHHVYTNHTWGEVESDSAEVKASTVRASIMKAQPEGNKQWSYTKGAYTIVMDDEPKLLYNNDGNVIGVDALVRVFKNGEEIKADPHRVGINPPLSVPTGKTKEITQVVAGKEMRITVPEYKEDPYAAYLSWVWDSVLEKPNPAGWRTKGTVTTVFGRTGDGYSYNVNATYTTARAGSGTFTTSDATTFMYNGQLLQGGPSYTVMESFLDFDTSSIGAGATVTAVALGISGQQDNSGTDFTAEARISNWGGTLTQADFVAGASLSSLTRVATYNTSGGVTISGYNTFTEDGTNFQTNLNKTGITSILLDSSRDVSSTAPTGAEYVLWNSADNTGTTNDPKLVITSTSGITVSGNVYTDEGSTAYNCATDNLTINVVVDGGSVASGTCTLSTGAFSVSTASAPAGADSPLVVFIDSTETPKATTVTLTVDNSSAISGVKLYQNHLVVSQESATAMTNTLLNTAANGNAGIRYAVSGGNLTVDSGIELHVFGGKTFTPGGSVTTQGSADFQLASSATATLGTATNTISGSIQVDTGGTLNINADTTVSGGGLVTAGTGVITTTSGTPTLTVSGTGNIGGGGAVTAYNVTINGTQTLASSLTANNDISVGSSGTLALGSQNVTISGGDLATTGSGTVTCSGCSSGTVTISGTGNIGGGGSVTVYNLTSSSGTQTISSATNINNTLTVNGTITGSSTLTVTADITGSGTMSMTGTTEQRVGANQNFGSSSGSNAWSFATLIFSNSTGTSKTVTTQSGGSGGITASTLLQIGKGGDTAATVLDAASRTWTLSGTSGTPFTLPQGSLTASTSTFSYTGNNSGGNTTIANTTYNNVTCTNGSETFNAAASPLIVNNNLTITAGTLDLQTNSLNVGSTSVTNSGNITNSGTITQSSSGTTTVKTSASGTASVGGSGTSTFYNLTLAPTAAGATITLGTSSSQTLTVTNNLSIGDGTNTVTVSANSNNPTVDVNGSITVNANGTFIAPPSASFTIAGNMTNNGTFTANGGTVTFDTASISTLAGSSNPAIRFYNLTSTTSGKTLKFTAGETFQTDGLITVTNGTINSTTSSQWFINHQGTENITSSTILNSGCSFPSTTSIDLNGTNTNGGNNNNCWRFGAEIQPARINGNTRFGGNTRFQ